MKKYYYNCQFNFRTENTIFILFFGQKNINGSTERNYKKYLSVTMCVQHFRVYE